MPIITQAARVGENVLIATASTKHRQSDKDRQIDPVGVTFEGNYRGKIGAGFTRWTRRNAMRIIAPTIAIATHAHFGIGVRVGDDEIRRSAGSGGPLR